MAAARTRRSPWPAPGVYAAVLGATLCTYAVGRLDVSRKFGNRVLDALDLDEPLPPTHPAPDRPTPLG